MVHTRPPILTVEDVEKDLFEGEKQDEVQIYPFDDVEFQRKLYHKLQQVRQWNGSKFASRLVRDARLVFTLAGDRACSRVSAPTGATITRTSLVSVVCCIWPFHCMC